ncbi:MAG: SDR family oxidoreductase [Burkholderiales bacterium]
MKSSAHSGDYDNKVVIITGASRGIGYATAQAFLEAGAKVAICAIDKARLNHAQKSLSRFGEVVAFAADVGLFREAQGFVQKVLQRFGRIDVLVNNAGRLAMGEFAQQDIADIDEVIDTNVKGALYTTRLVLPLMVGRSSGVIINVSSGIGLHGRAGFAVYCASKSALIGFTQSLAQEVEKQGVSVYAICPGAVAPGMQPERFGEMKGMPAERVAEKILKLAGSRPPIRAGEHLEVYR